MKSLFERIAGFLKAHRAARIALIIAAVLLTAILLLHPKGTKTFLIIGVDNYDSLDKNNGRSDVTMLVQIDFTRSQIKTVSFARDMIVKDKDNRDAKLNTIIRLGGEEALLSAIEQNFGVSIDHWFRVNFASVILLVDALGGATVDLTSQEAIYIDRQIGKYDDHPLSEGPCLLNGEQALTFARCRKLDNDIGRGARQGKLLAAMVAQTKKLTPSKLVGVFNSLKNMWRSSMSAGGQAALLSQALWLRGAKVEAYTVPFDGQWQYGNDGVVLYKANRPMLLDALGYPPEKADAAQ